MLEDGLSTSEICDVFGFTNERDRHAMSSMLYKIRSGSGYTQISKDYNIENYDAEAQRIRSLRKHPDAVYRAIIYMWHTNHLTAPEIGEILGMPRQTVASIIRKLSQSNAIPSEIDESSSTIESIA